MRVFILFITLFCLSVTTANAAPPPVEAYAEIPALRDGALSPNGQKLAVITQVDNKFAVQIIDISNIKKPKIVSGNLPEEVFPRWINWANDDSVFVSVQRTYKSFQYDARAQHHDFVYILRHARG